MAGQYALPQRMSLSEGKPATSAHYRKMREQFADELKDPATKRLLMAIISAENPGAGSAVVESLMNRTAMVNEQRAADGKPPLTLKSMIHGDASIGGGKSFYGPVRTGAVNQHLARVDADKDYATQLDSYITSALGGADTIEGHTDQGSKGDPNYDAGGVGVNIAGERFNDWGYGGSRAWREKNQALARNGEPLDPTPNVGSGEDDYRTRVRIFKPGSEPEIATSGPTTNPNVSTDAAAAAINGRPVDYGGVASNTFNDMAKLYANGPVVQNAARPSGPANVPGSGSLPTPPGVQPIVDPKRAEMQRQMLALAMQRLNSGKLV